MAITIQSNLKKTNNAAGRAPRITYSQWRQPMGRDMRCVWSVLQSFNPCYPTLAQIATLSGISESSARRAIKALEAQGWIRVFRIHKGSTARGLAFEVYAEPNFKKLISQPFKQKAGVRLTGAFQKSGCQADSPKEQLKNTKGEQRKAAAPDWPFDWGQPDGAPKKEDEVKPKPKPEPWKPRTYRDGSSRDEYEEGTAIEAPRKWTPPPIDAKATGKSNPETNERRDNSEYVLSDEEKTALGDISRRWAEMKNPFDPSRDAQNTAHLIKQTIDRMTMKH